MDLIRIIHNDSHEVILDTSSISKIILNKETVVIYNNKIVTEISFCNNADAARALVDKITSSIIRPSLVPTIVSIMLPPKTTIF